jgi:hypothetical protein
MPNGETHAVAYNGAIKSGDAILFYVVSSDYRGCIIYAP